METAIVKTSFSCSLAQWKLNSFTDLTTILAYLYFRMSGLAFLGELSCWTLKQRRLVSSVSGEKHISCFVLSNMLLVDLLRVVWCFGVSSWE